MSDLSQSYNDTLNEYRRDKGITHDIEPVPNLKFDDWYFEIPFWGVVKNQYRDSLWAKTDGKMLTLKMKGVDTQFTFHWDDLQNELSTSPLKIWPKAIPQTLFLRMYLCDFFIHGVGGGVYEEVVDKFFYRTAVLEPPTYGVISATYFIDPEEFKELEGALNYLKKIETWKRALEQNPEYLFTRQSDWKRDLPETLQAPFEKCLADPSLVELAAEKKILLDQLKDPAQRVLAGKKIKELNRSLIEAYSEVFQVIVQGLSETQAVEEAKNVFGFREYPFFCFGEDIYLDMKQKINQALTGVPK
jgi:hypothetical protein